MRRRIGVDFIEKRANSWRSLLEAHKNVAFSLQARVVHRLDDYIASELIAVAKMLEPIRSQ
jgi:hypothetical protein